MRRKGRSENTGEDTIQDERHYVDWYVVDNRGKIRGEARRFDLYSRIGEIMLYDIDSFGFICGYVSTNWHVMSEQDLLEDKKLSRRLYEARYQVWKRNNVTNLHEEYEKTSHASELSFNEFCRKTFRGT